MEQDISSENDSLLTTRQVGEGKVGEGKWEKE